jgi:hypothetical protein
MTVVLKRRMVIAAAAVAVAAFAGGAYAATQGSSQDPRQAFLNDVAGRLHVTPQQLSAAFKGAAIDQLNAAVASGRLTQAEANERKQRIEQGGPAPGRPPFFGGPGSFGVAHEGGQIGAAASYLGLTAPQLFGQLQAGKSLAQIATAHGKSVSGLKAAITAQIKARLDQAVARNMMSSAQEQQILSSLSARLDELINGIHKPGIEPHGFMGPPPMGAAPSAGPTY